LRQVDSLIQSAQGLAYRVTAIDGEYRRLFPEQYASAVSTSRIIADPQEAWALARKGFKHSLEVQAEVVGQVRTDAVVLDRLVAESQGAVGNLQVAQAGNQLTALAAKQTMQLQTLLAASARADALERARMIAAREQGRARFERFLGDHSAYTRR
jgi:P-type conjugative transfer protein TrbJ